MFYSRVKGITRRSDGRSPAALADNQRRQKTVVFFNLSFISIISSESLPPFDLTVDSESSRLQTLHAGIRAEKDRCESLSALTQRLEDQRLPACLEQS